jgi:iron complex outermembrane receptor protein
MSSSTTRSILLAGSFLSYAVVSQAQQAADAGLTAQKDQDEIVVTGTRTSRTVTASPVPIQVLNAAELKETGKINLRDALQQLVPSYNNAAGWTGGTGEASKSASLRGLSGDQALVLVDGKRRHATGLVFITAQGNVGASPVDLDFIPAGAIDHVEVLTDGAAAQYGSDAVAGVINIILKKGAEGGAASADYGQYASSPSGTKAHYGNDGHFVADQGFGLGVDGFVRISADINLQNPTNQLGAASPYTGAAPGTAAYQQTELYFPGDKRNLTANRFVAEQGLPLTNTYNFGYNAELPLTDDITAYSYSTYSHQYSRNNGIFRPADSQQNIPEVYPDGYLPEFIVVQDDEQGVLGVRGTDLFGFGWDLSTTVGQNDSDERNEAGLNPSLGPSSPHNFDNGHLIATEWTTNFDLNRAIDTGLFETPLSFAPGIELRTQSFEQVAGDPASYTVGPYQFPAGTPLAGKFPSGGASGLGGFSPSSAGSHSRLNFASYIDLDQKLLPNLELGLAGRVEHYSDVGDTLSGKVSARWEFIPGYALRGSASNGFRAPSLQQEFYTSDLPNYIQDPAHPGNVILQDTRYVPPGSAIGKALGAQPLKPETSIDYTVGVTAQPFDASHFSLDVYQIEIDNRIVETGTIQGAGVNAILASIGQAPATIQYFTNGADTRTRGIDLAADYSSDFGDYGHVKWGVQSAFNWQEILDFKPTPPVLASLGLTTLNRQAISNLVNLYPKNRTTVSALWDIGDWEINLRESRYSSVILVVQNAIPGDDSRNPPAFITDLDVTYNINDNARVTIGANNLFNKFPVKLNQKASIDNGWYSGVNYNLASPYGYNGGFYYARIAYQW